MSASVVLKLLTIIYTYRKKYIKHIPVHNYLKIRSLILGYFKIVSNSINVTHNPLSSSASNMTSYERIRTRSRDPVLSCQTSANQSYFHQTGRILSWKWFLLLLEWNHVTEMLHGFNYLPWWLNPVTVAVLVRQNLLF